MMAFFDRIVQTVCTRKVVTWGYRIDGDPICWGFDQKLNVL